MNTEFNNWWNEDLLTEDNPHVDGTPAFWAWEGWCAAVKAEHEVCTKLCEGIVALNEYAYADECVTVLRARNPK